AFFLWGGLVDVRLWLENGTSRLNRCGICRSWHVQLQNAVDPSESPGPELHRLCRLGIVADVSPGEIRRKALDPRIAALGPEGVERNIVVGSRRMARLAHDRRENAGSKVLFACGPLAFLEEANANAFPAVVTPQHRFAEIEIVCRVEAAFPERLSERVEVVSQR